MSPVGAILVAAGTGQRLGAAVPKAYVPLAGRSPLAWTIEAFREAAIFTEIVIVAGKDDLNRAEAIVPPHGKIRWRVVPGGARRQDSVRLGLIALSHDVDLVAVHDAARPLVSPDLIRRLVTVAARSGAATAVLPAADTVHQVDSGGTIVSTPPRTLLRLAQTPQVFRRDLLVQAHERAILDQRGETDDAALVAVLGHPVSVEPGEQSNRKITSPEDLAFAEAFLSRRSQHRP